MEITTPGLQLVLPSARERWLPNRRSIAQFVAALLVMFGLIAVFASERANSPSNPDPTGQANLGVYPPSLATPELSNGADLSAEAKLLWEVPTRDAADGIPILVDAVVQNGVAYFLEQGVELYAVDAKSGDLLWTADVGQNWGVAVDETGAYVTARVRDNDASTQLIKFDLATGGELWRATIGGALSSQPMLRDGVAYAWDAADNLFAVDTQAGTVLWHRSTDDPNEPSAYVPSSMENGVNRPNSVLNGDSIYLVTSDGLFSRIDLANAESGEWTWQFQLERSVDSPLIYHIAVVGDAVGVVSNPSDTPDPATNDFEGQFNVLNRNTGEELWLAPAENYAWLISTRTQFIVTTADATDSSTPEAETSSSFPYSVTSFNAMSGDIDWTSTDVFVGGASDDGSLLLGSLGETYETFMNVAIDASTGKQLGVLSSTMSIVSPLGVADGSFYGRQLDGDLAAVDLSEFRPSASPQEADSALLWQSAWTGDDAGGPKAFALANGMIYRFQADDSFHGIEAIDAISGEVKWRSQAIGDGIAADENGVYVTIGAYSQADIEARNQPKTVIALDPTTGTELWSLATETGETEPIVKDGVLYIRESISAANVSADFTEEISAIDTVTGEILWITDIAAPSLDITTDLPLPQHSMVVSDEWVAIVASRGEIIGINSANGQRTWEQSGFPANATDLGLSGDMLIASSYFYNNGAPTAFPEITTQSAVVAMKISDGAPLWSRDLGDLPTNVAVAQGFAWITIDADLLPQPDYDIATPEGAVSESDWAIVGIDIATGEIAHNGGGGGGEGRGPDLVAIDDSTYVLTINSGSASFNILEPTSGNSEMNDLYFGQPIVGAPISDGERVYLQLQDGTIVAVNQSMPPPQMSQDEYRSLLPETGGPLPDSVVWHVEQDVAWPPEAIGLPLGGMAVSDGIVYRAVAGFSFESEETAVPGIEAYDALSGELLWQTPLRFMSIGNTFGDSIVAGDGALFVVVNTSPNENGPPPSSALVALDGQSGDERWRIEFEENSPFMGPDYDPTQDTNIDTMTYNDGVLYVANSSAVVTAFNSQTGEELWKSDAAPNRTMTIQATVVSEGTITEVQGDETQGSQLSITVAGDRIFVVTQGGSVVALDASTGEYSGEAIPSSTENTTAPVLIGNLLIVGNTVWDFTADGFQIGKSGTLTAFDVSNNYAIVWEKQIGLSADNVLAIGDALFVTTMISEQRDSVVQRIDPDTGDALWNTGNLGQYLLLRNTVGPDGSLLAASFYEGTLTTLDPETGGVLATNDNLPALAIEPGDNGLYFATLLDGTLVAINPSS